MSCRKPYFDEFLTKEDGGLESGDALDIRGVQLEDVDDFVTAEQKRVVLTQWDGFLRSGFKLERFGKELYEHLVSHCGFRWSVSASDFWELHFADPEQTLKFIKQFDLDLKAISSEQGNNDWLYTPGYFDLNAAMCRVWDSYKTTGYLNLQNQVVRRDIETAKSLLRKHGIFLDESAFIAPRGQLQRF